MKSLPFSVDAADLPDVAGVISDLDGVVYRGSEPIPSAVATFRHWWEQGTPYCFVTNNSTHSPEDVAQKLTMPRRIGSLPVQW